ncbi:MAG: hypothetical protein ACRDMX_18305, partial [Solirubrobacteraceae bacterium]
PVPRRRATPGPTIDRTFRALARSDAEAAGRLLLALLPLQGTAWRGAIAYDIVPDARGGPCLWVTAAAGSTTIRVSPIPRPRDEVDLQLIGAPGRIARLLIAGRWRRRSGLGVARVRGRRAGLAALAALLALPLDLGELHRAGVRLDAETALSLVAGMIDPRWTAGERFALALVTPGARPAHLVVRDGRPPRVIATAPSDGIATTVGCRADRLAPALAGDSVHGLNVAGEERPLRLLREWIVRAQSG